MPTFTVIHPEAEDPWECEADTHQDAARQWGQHHWDFGNMESIAVRCAKVKVSGIGSTLFFETNVLAGEDEDDEEVIANERSKEEYLDFAKQCIQENTPRSSHESNLDTEDDGSISLLVTILDQDGKKYHSFPSTSLDHKEASDEGCKWLEKWGLDDLNMTVHVGVVDDGDPAAGEFDVLFSSHLPEERGKFG